MNPLSIAALAGLIGGMGMGGFITQAVMAERIAIMESTQAKAVAMSAQIYHQRFVDAQVRGDALSNQLSQTESELNQRTLEVSRALSKVTTGRVCLGDAAIRLLNGTHDNRAAEPEATGTSVAENGAVATDTDVASWISNAQGQYEICRARLGSLIDYEQGIVNERTK